MGYNIGSFKATDTGYAGTIETLTHKITADFTRVLERTNQSAPAYEIYSGELRIGAALLSSNVNSSVKGVPAFMFWTSCSNAAHKSHTRVGCNEHI